MGESALTAPPKPARLWSLPVLSWALYDLANTMFSMSIVSLYFSLWVVNVMGGNDQMYGNANALSMALMFLTAPLIGAISDQASRRKPFLVISTLLCVLFTALLGVGGLGWSLLFFVVANYMFQAGLIFYDSLLPEVSTPENRGRVGGLGIGLGYLGSFIIVGLGLMIVRDERPEAFLTMFRLTALLFFIFALPCFLFVHERARRTAGLSWRVVRGAFGQVRHTVAHAREFPGLVRFLVGRIFYTDPVNTVIVFMGVYVTNEVNFTTTEAQLLLLVAIAAAVVGGFVWGIVVDRIGPKRTLNVVLGLWMVDFLVAVAIAVFDWPKALFWGAGVLAGIALWGTWAADRPWMLILSPPKFVGEFYGLYSMVGRFAAIVGPFMWGLIVDQLGLGRPAAVFTLFLFVVVAFLILQGVDDRPREWPPELQLEAQ
ncbi:MAG: MFS transporter [Ardenticatenia bacterium]|nr:MFS transporter [Ardenticatenia bacterium]